MLQLSEICCMNLPSLRSSSLLHEFHAKNNAGTHLKMNLTSYNRLYLYWERKVEELSDEDYSRPHVSHDWCLGQW